MRFTPTKKGNPCQLCSDTKGKCREKEGGELLLCMSLAEEIDVPGWHFAGLTKDGLWGQWIPNEDRTEQEKAEWRCQLELRRQQREAEERQRRAEALPAEVRDRQYRRVLTQLTLHPEDRADLHRRGLSDEQIKSAGFKSVDRWQRLDIELPHALPGVQINGRSLNISQAGYLCPIRDVDGLIIGFQLRRREAGDGGRYRWLSSSTKKRPNGPTPHLPNGELPLAIHRPAEPRSNAIAFVEGTGPKPFIASQRLGCAVVGAAGGQWASSPETLKETLGKIGGGPCILYPDAGAIENLQVMRQYRNLDQALGGKLQVAWWGQETKADRDIDELDDLSQIKLLSFSKFEKLSKCETGKESSRKANLRALADRRKRETQEYYRKLAEKLSIEIDGDKPEVARRQISSHLTRLFQIENNGERGYFAAIELPLNERQLLALVGEMFTSKTGSPQYITGIFSTVAWAQKHNKTALIVSPSRVLAKALASLLGVPFHMQAEAFKAPIAVTCPESVHKFTFDRYDIVILDEVNEDIGRSFAGTLGTAPKLARKRLAQYIRDAQHVVIAQDGLLRPSLGAIQRLGNFQDCTRIIERRRTPTQMRMRMYRDILGQNSDPDRWDGTEKSKIGASPNDAFYSMIAEIIKRLERGEKVAIPCGSQKKLRKISRALRQHFGKTKKICALDGQYTPSAVRMAFAENPNAWILSQQPDALLWSPVFNSGVSIEVEYFDTQFEVISNFETASSASQRGNRVRDAIKGNRIKERHIYISDRGLPSKPDPELFTSAYWFDLLCQDAKAGYGGALKIAKKHRVDGILKDAIKGNLAEISDYRELADFLASEMHQLYFKPELLEAEWSRNGWSIENAPTASAGQLEEIKGLMEFVGQGLIEQRSRILAKAKAKQLEEGVEAQGPIEDVKDQKFSLEQTLGQYPALSDPKWMEAWVIEAGNSGGLSALKIRSLVQMSIDSPDAWKEVCYLESLKTVLATQDTSHDLPELPFSRRELAIAKLLSRCPGISQAISGELEQWCKFDNPIIEAASYARENAIKFAALSKHSQRYLGFQFTDKTPDIKCFHKLLLLAGVNAIAHKRSDKGKGAWLYRLEGLGDIELKMEHNGVTYNLLRKAYRAESAEATLNQLSEVATPTIEMASKSLGRLERELFGLDQELQKVEIPIPEVLDPGDFATKIETLSGHLEALARANGCMGCQDWATYEELVSQFPIEVRKAAYKQLNSIEKRRLKYLKADHYAAAIAKTA